MEWVKHKVNHLEVIVVIATVLVVIMAITVNIINNFLKYILLNNQFI